MARGYELFYERVSAPWRRIQGGRQAITAIDKALALAVALCYVAVCVFLVAVADVRAARAICVPAATFAVTSVLRSFIDAPRPYQSHRINPLIAKTTRGKSLPSRHMASVVVIACTFWWLSAVAGAACIPLVAAIGYVRVAGGVHYPRDIVAACALSLACAFVGFALVPLPPSP